MNRLFLFGAFLALLAAVVQPAAAAVVIEGTRVIYPATERETTVKMVNKGDDPVLMQVWADRGDPRAQPQTADAPFLVMPPIFRLDAGKGQAVRMVFTGENLPADRESLFWFNALEIPAMPKVADRNYMQVAIRSRLKIFYRPASLRGDLPSAVESVRWKVLPGEHGSVLHADNPSPYHVTFTHLQLIRDGRTFEAESGMIDPFASRDFAIAGFHADAANAKVRYGWMSDYGPGPTAEAPLR